MAYHEPYLKTRASEYGADVRARLMTGQFVLATQYLKAQRARQVLRAEVDGVLTRRGRPLDSRRRLFPRLAWTSGRSRSTA